MHPAERVGRGQVVVDRRIIAQQQVQHRHAGLRVGGRHRQRIADLLLLLRRQGDAPRPQLLLERVRAQVGLPWEDRHEALAQRGRQARAAQPGQRFGIEPEDWRLAPQYGQHILAGAAGPGVVAGEQGIADHMTDLVLPVHPRRGLVGGDPIALGHARDVDRVGLHRPLAIRVQPHPRHRAGADVHAHIAQEGPQRGLADVRAMAQRQRQGTEGRAKRPLIARRQRGRAGRLGAGDVPDLAHKADHLRRDAQVLHQPGRRLMAQRIRGQGGRVDDAAFLTGDRQGRVFWGFPPRRAGAALGLRGVIGGRRRDGRLDRRLPRAPLQPGQCIAELLVLPTQGGNVRRLRLDEVQQLHHDLAQR